MHTKTILTSLAAFAFAACAGAATAASMGDADPGYPGQANGPVDMSNSTAKSQPRSGVTRIGAAQTQGEAKTRAQVKAETLEAIRVGAMNRGERFVFPTAQQLDSIEQAGLRALEPAVAATRGSAVAN